MYDPLVTIILTTLNSERYLAKSLQSCLVQTYRNIEVLVVDGGSRDRTLEIVASFTDNRIRMIHQENNAGRLPGAINLGLENSLGEYITWMQDDCWYVSNAIETMLTVLMQNPSVGLVYTDYWDVDEEGKIIKYQKVHSPEDILIDDVVRSCFLLRREVYTIIGPQDTQYFPSHEVPWRIKVSQQFQMLPWHKPLLYYTVQEYSLTGRIGMRNLSIHTAGMLLNMGSYDRAGYRKQLSRIEMNEAYEAMAKGSFSSFWKYALRAIYYNPGTFKNRGLIKFLLLSILPGRENFRNEYVRGREKELQAAIHLHRNSG